MNGPKQIAELASFYVTLYGPCDNFTDEELQSYIGGMILPTLTHKVSMELETPLTLEELQPPSLPARPRGMMGSPWRSTTNMEK